MELVAGTGKAAQAHALEAVMRLQMRKAHLDSLPLITRFEECLRLHLAASDVAGSLVDVPHDPARWHVWTASLLQRAIPAARHGCKVADRMIAMDPTARCQRFARWTNVNVASAVELELRSRERAVVPPAHVPNRDVRDDAGAGDEGQEPADPVGRVSREPLGAKLEAVPRTLDHCAGRRDLVIGARRCRLDIDNDGVLDIDQIVEAVAEQDALVGLGSPGRRWIARRNHLRRLAVRLKVAPII